MFFVDFIDFFAKENLPFGETLEKSEAITLTSLFIPVTKYYNQIPKQESCQKDHTVIKDKTLYADDGISINFLNWFVGFTDGEGNFTIGVNKNNVSFTFNIEVHIDDIQSLEEIKKNLKVGYIMKLKTKNNVRYTVKKLDHIKNVIIPIFSKYNLCTIKALSFEKFRAAFNIKGTDRARLTQEQYSAILKLKAGMNKGLDPKSPEVKNFYKDANRRLCINAYWLLGFIEGEGRQKVKSCAFAFPLDSEI
jgi:LAGLIDADG endonuclease